MTSVLTFIAGCLVGGFVMWVLEGCKALHKAMRDAMADLRP